MSTSAVARSLSVSPSTVKRWIDEGLIPAVRTPGGHRRLLVDDVRRFAEGERISILRAPFAPPKNAIEELLAAFRMNSRLEVRRVLLGSLESMGSIARVGDELIGPAMTALGDQWEKGQLSIMHEHRATELCQGAIHELIRALPPPPEDGPVAVGATPLGDVYTLPGLLAQGALSELGIHAFHLGIGVSAKVILHEVARHRASIMWFSISHLPEPTRFAEEYSQAIADMLSQGIDVIVGGRAVDDRVLSQLPMVRHGQRLAELMTWARERLDGTKDRESA